MQVQCGSDIEKSQSAFAVDGESHSEEMAGAILQQARYHHYSTTSFQPRPGTYPRFCHQLALPSRQLTHMGSTGKLSDATILRSDMDDTGGRVVFGRASDLRRQQLRSSSCRYSPREQAALAQPWLSAARRAEHAA